MPEVTSSISVPFPLTGEETVLHTSSWSKGGMVAQMLFISLPLMGISLMLLRAGGDVFGVGILAAVLSTASYFLAYLSCSKRTVFVKNKKVVLVAGLTDTIKTISLSQIDQVTTTPSVVTVRAGSIMNMLILSVPDTANLASCIDKARHSILYGCRSRCAITVRCALGF